MAIYTPDIDYSATAQAIAQENNVRQAGINIRNQNLNTQSLERAGKSLDLQKQSLNLQKAQLITDTVFSLADIGIGIWQQAEAKTEQAQFEVAKTQAYDQSITFSEMIAESVLNGGTKLVQDQNGMWDIQMDQGLLDWRDSQMAAIEASDDTPTVKAWKMQALNQTYESGSQQILSGVLKQSQQTIENQFGVNIGKAMQADVKTSNADSRNYENGLGLINSRMDLAPQAKAVEAELYKQMVDKNVESKTITTLAATQGQDVATEYAYTLLDKGYTVDDVTAFVATATRVDQQLTSAASTTVSNVMTKGLSSGKPASELWNEIEKAVEKMPEGRKQEAMEAARLAQVSFATDAAMSMWVADADADIDTLQERRDDIANGNTASQWFYNIPEVQDKFVGLYDKLITGAQTAQGKLSTETVKNNKTAADVVFQRFQNGDLSGNQAMSVLMELGKNTEDLADDEYALRLLGKLKDSIVPEKFKPTADSFLKQMESLNYGIGPDRDDFTAEQEEALAKAKQWSYGMIADLFMAAPSGSISDSMFADTLGQIKRVYTSDLLDTVGKATIRAKNPTKDMLDLGYELGKEKTVYFDDVSGRIQWAHDGYKEAYDKVAGQFGNVLKENGITVKDAPHPLVIGEEVYPIPQMRGTESDGVDRIYTFNRNDIFSSTDSGATWDQRWMVEGTDFDATKFLSSEEKVARTEIDTYFDQFRTGKTPATPPTDPLKEPDPEPPKEPTTTQTSTSAQDTAPDWANDRVARYRNATVKKEIPDVSPADDAARMDLANAQKTVRSMSERNQTLLRNYMKAWMKQNPGQTPTKDSFGSRIQFINDRQITAMWRILQQEGNKE